MEKVNFAAVKDVIRAAWPSYRGRKCYVGAMSENGVTMSGTYWQEGYRDSYAAVELDTLRSIPLPHFDPPQFGGPRVDPVITKQHLGPNGIVVVHCQAGQREYIRIFAQPHQLPKLLTAAA